MQIPRLLIDDFVRAGGSVKHREVLMIGELLDRFRFRIVREDIELTVAVRAKIDVIAHPHGIDVVRAAFGLGKFLSGIIAKVVKPDG